VDNPATSGDAKLHGVKFFSIFKEEVAIRLIYEYSDSVFIASGDRSGLPVQRKEMAMGLQCPRCHEVEGLVLCNHCKVVACRVCGYEAGPGGRQARLKETELIRSKLVALLHRSPAPSRT